MIITMKCALLKTIKENTSDRENVYERLIFKIEKMSEKYITILI